MQIVNDKNYCRLCRKFNINTDYNRTNYCQKCKNNIAINNNTFNRWISSTSFIDTSFIDCVDSEEWHGFRDIKFRKTLIDQLTVKFTDLKYLISTSERQKIKNYTSNNFLYLLSDGKKNLFLNNGKCQI
jgi:hypothetical protein